MTYEPGQQLLVRATYVDGANIPGGAAYLISIRGTRTLVEDEDVVGTAPATPSQTTYDVAADCLTALARITSERDALIAEIDKGKHEFVPGGPIINFMDGCEKCWKWVGHPDHRTAALILGEEVGTE